MGKEKDKILRTLEHIAITFDKLGFSPTIPICNGHQDFNYLFRLEIDTIKELCEQQSQRIAELEAKLAEFEDFMEEQGFEDLEHLELHLKNLSYGAKYYVFWEKLKEYITQKIETDYDWCTYVYPEGLSKMQEILEKMQELELADLSRRKEK